VNEKGSMIAEIGDCAREKRKDKVLRMLYWN